MLQLYSNICVRIFRIHLPFFTYKIYYLIVNMHGTILIYNTIVVFKVLASGNCEMKLQAQYLPWSIHCPFHHSDEFSKSHLFQLCVKGPGVPLGPGRHWLPQEPLRPGRPCLPHEPSSPLFPSGPVGPSGPWSPCDPDAPAVIGLPGMPGIPGVKKPALPQDLQKLNLCTTL